MNEQKTGGPAFPTAADNGHSWNQDGMTLRDYFAAHAPSEPWPHYQPTIPPAPESPSPQPIGNDGEAPDERMREYLRDWRNNEFYGDPSTLAAYSHWCDAWTSYRKEMAEHQRMHRREYVQQWPYFYADAMLAERAK